MTVIAEPGLTLPGQNPDASPRPTPRTEPALSGPADLLPVGAAEIQLSVRLPDGWLQAGDSMYLRLAGDQTPMASISAWNIDRIHVFPCRWSAATFASPILMATARGQAEALSSWWGQDAGIPYANSDLAPLATRPTEMAFGGMPAWYTSVLITRAFDLAACDGGQIVLWEAEDLVRAARPGELHELYIVEIDGDVIVVDATSASDTAAPESSELQDIVASVSVAP